MILRREVFVQCSESQAGLDSNENGKREIGGIIIGNIFAVK